LFVLFSFLFIFWQKTSLFLVCKDGWLWVSLAKLI